MKKKIIGACLAAVMTVLSMSPVQAYSTDQGYTAEALNELGLFLGNGVSYDLDSSLTRAQATTLLVRILGKEAEAQNGQFLMPFTDVPEWAEGYVGYAFENRITNGMGEDVFGSDYETTDYMFLTLTLRALGYNDNGNDAQFVWNNPYKLAAQTGLITSEKADASFLRGDAVIVMWNALKAQMAGSNETLAEYLIEEGIFTRSDYMAATIIQRLGREGLLEILIRPDKPSVPVIPDEPDEPDEPSWPTIPDEPEEPDEPVNPSKPTIPDEPEEPDEPVNPSKPTIPDEPEEPDEPMIPSKPTIPDEPEEPDEPVIPSKPTIPDEPDEPVNPSKPTIPDEPGNGNSGDSEWGSASEDD